MRRWRTVAMATLILATVVYFVAQHQDRLQETYQFGVPFRQPDRDESTKRPSDIELHPPPILPNEDTLQKEPTSSRPSNDHLSNIHSDHDPDLPSNNAQNPLPTTPEPAQIDFHPEFSFQNDLNLILPEDALKSFSNYKPHNYNPNGPKTQVFATLMSTRNPSLKDPYYLATLSLVYRVLWSPRSRTENHAFVVFVRDFVTPEQRQLLTGAGAIVRELEPLDWAPNVEGIQSRWKDLFAKLNMWKETEFSKIVFLDADAFPIANIDAMFDLTPEQNCIESKLSPFDDILPDGTSTCEPYAFGGVPHTPFNETSININGGVLVFSPSLLMHQRLLQNYLKYDRYDVMVVEQGFLDWQFNINGAFPATGLQREWGATFPQEDEEGQFKVVHEKIWSAQSGWMRKEWEEQWVEMTNFFMGQEFRRLREADGVV